ncbi:DegT/DnrJ/EryC1/StrS family aminotransferase [Pseudomonas sp. NPDC007930]|uniref:DegT/DnrJ/EryC1/StrS family aminotransferase n=1 Tax=Pseudomonas sp. NPDC007930 TaxID=3364417 RepID=UPI0036E287F3
MLNGPFSPWPSYSMEEADAVKEVTLSNKVNYWTGEHARKFETEFAHWVGSKYAVAVANGTVALDLALIGLGIGPGDEVIVTSRTFLASVSSIVNVGAVPVFADVDLNSQNFSSSSIAELISTKTKAIVCVHLAGWPCEMDEILALADRWSLKIIEDCAQAHGAVYRARSVGSIGHVGAWSFCQDKIMTTLGEGGMVTTNDEELWRKMWSYKDHGKSWDSIYLKQHPPGFRWLHESFGTNWRITEIQAAVGRIQLKKMPQWTALRIANANKIWATARLCKGLRVPVIPEHVKHGAYKCYVFVEPEKLAEGWSRDRIIAEITSAGVPCFSGSCSEVYLEKAFDGTGYRPANRLANAKELGDTSLMFLVHPTLTSAEIEKTCRVLQEVLEAATCAH